MRSSTGFPVTTGTGRTEVDVGAGARRVVADSGRGTGPSRPESSHPESSRSKARIRGVRARRVRIRKARFRKGSRSRRRRAGGEPEKTIARQGFREVPLSSQSGSDQDRSRTVCQHPPARPFVDAPDREAARLVISHPERGWGLLRDGVVVLQDAGTLAPGGRGAPARRDPRGRTA
ncbi:DUF5999 family protein [Streptosporangium sp. NPDC002721]|uniref:DUF5999 family protein n=1 Tax=Streptosporangium sp. NPDC002721 TaxID=3366188 RepID=UPI0036986D91